MLREIISNLTIDQRAKLAAHGVSNHRLYSWRSGNRLPTEVQTAYLADATGTDWAELQKEITVLRADESEREEVARLLNWRKR